MSSANGFAFLPKVLEERRHLRYLLIKCKCFVAGCLCLLMTVLYLISRGAPEIGATEQIWVVFEFLHAVQLDDCCIKVWLSLFDGRISGDRENSGGRIPAT
jgi:hypothetical protein